jgi:thiamine pyrophosphokinase
VLRGTMPIGVSNEFIGVKSEIAVANGSVAVLWEESAAGVIENLKEAYSSGSGE